MRATGSSEPMLSHCQPWVVTSAPEANEVTAMVAKTKKFMAACARSFSSGRHACNASVVLPVNRKFQPMPSRNSAIRNWCRSTPDRAIAMQAKFSATPAPMTFSAPNRLIR